MGSGDIKYLPKIHFYLTSKNFTSFQIAQLSKDYKTPATFLADHGASPELVLWYREKKRAWIAKMMTAEKYEEDVELKAVENGLAYGSYELLKKYPDIPEFRVLVDRLDNLLTECQNSSRSSCSPGRENEYRKLKIRDTIEQSSFSFLKPDSSYEHYSRLHLFSINSKAREELRKYIVASCTTNFDATCVLGPVKTGKYYLTNIEPAMAGRSLVLWNLETVVMPGQKYIELSNDNEARLKNYAIDEYEYKGGY